MDTSTARIMETKFVKKGRKTNLHGMQTSMGYQSISHARTAPPRYIQSCGVMAFFNVHTKKMKIQLDAGRNMVVQEQQKMGNILGRKLPLNMDLSPA